MDLREEAIARETIPFWEKVKWEPLAARGLCVVEVGGLKRKRRAGLEMEVKGDGFGALGSLGRRLPCVFLGWRLDTSGRDSLAGNPRLGAWNRLTGENTPETLALYQDRG